MGRGRDKRKRQTEKRSHGRPPEPPPVRTPPTPSAAARHVLPFAVEPWRAKYAACGTHEADDGERATDSATNMVGDFAVDGAFTWRALKAMWRKPPCTPPPCPDCKGPTVVYAAGHLLFNGIVSWACLACGVGCQSGVAPDQLRRYVADATGASVTSTAVTIAARSSGVSGHWPQQWRDSNVRRLRTERA